MRKTILIIGGVVQVLVTALHVSMFFGLRTTTQVPEGLKPLLYIFNAAVTTLVVFLAYLSLFRRSEMIETPLGRGICWFVAVFYLQRGIVPIVVRGFDPTDFAVMAAIASLYAFAAAPFWPRRVASAAQAA